MQHPSSSVHTMSKPHAAEMRASKGLACAVSPLRRLAVACGLALVAAGAAHAQSSLMRDLRNANAAQASPSAVARSKISPVREAVLRDTARQLGAQAGMAEEGQRIIKLVNAQAAHLDETYRFSDLIMQGHILPPVISQANDAMSVDSAVLRVASRVYRIDAPARPVRLAPTWREWLLLGLSSAVAPAVPQDPNLLPRNDDEQAYWQAQLDEAYQQGVRQAQSTFDVNMNRLDRSYKGMRRFFELHARGMVTAPTLITTQSVIDREDPNTVAVGTTVWRIVQPTAFVEAYERWVPLGK